jgi:Fe2+ transport system protein B
MLVRLLYLNLWCPFLLAQLLLMLLLNKELQTEKSNFLNTLNEEKGIEKTTKKLDTFYELEYDDFKKELRKQKVKISLGNENNEWREYFNTTKQKLNELQNKINQTDKEIDKMVYELYELTQEEIEIVENSTK